MKKILIGLGSILIAPLLIPFLLLWLLGDAIMDKTPDYRFSPPPPPKA